ncbi:MAG: hypothetical protein F4205_17815 [Gemmatimonadetes bacterium]|nr:hypothetical protein [Gemmatimonadota bacterium]MXX72172.1 hypothetical protein [Gemmatimonadota bacterium]MYC92915.1 hypothetical protein [Gemmatimonadota bacterium]MYG37332.1 hypothetical protein [Gemmatimonadota bacterium]
MRGPSVARTAAAARILPAALLLLVVCAAADVSLHAQERQRLPLAPILPKGDEVAPFFEGWYRNDDGTFTLSFGFFNLNSEQVLDIPVGPDNFIEPAEFDGAQPTHFPVRPRRDRGVFHVTVPASYEDGEQAVVWTITANGWTNATPGRVGIPALQLDYGPRAMGSVPPVVRFTADGPAGQHVQGMWGEPRTATVGEPLTLTLWTEEVSVRAPDDMVNQVVDVGLSWFKHQGPAGAITVDPRRVTVEGGTGEATASVVFSEPGEYVLRARIDNWDANDSTGGDQCCWTNAYVRVTVTP